MSAPGDYQMVYEGYRQRIWVSALVFDLIDSHRQVHTLQSEAFGVLIGTTSVDKKERWVDVATAPMTGDSRSRHSFSLRDPGHQTVVDKAFKRSGGSRIYLGTWHTHPEPKPEPSRVDKVDWHRCMERNKRRPLLFIIAGTRETSAFVPWGRFFRRLKSCEIRDDH